MTLGQRESCTLPSFSQQGAQELLMSFAYMPFYTGDYYRDTRHLSLLQHGAYRLLLDHCWDQRGPLPLDLSRCYRICGAVSKEEQDAVGSVIAEFFIRMEDGHYNSRLQREIERCNAISEARSDAGKLGGLAKAKHLPSKRHASAKQVPLSPPPSPPPSSKETTNTHPAGGVSDVDRLNAFWAAYPRRQAKAAAAKAFSKLRVDDVMLARMLSAIATQRESDQWRRDGGKYIPMPATWLNGRRWEDEDSMLPGYERAVI